MNDKAPMHVCFFHFTKLLIPLDTNYIVGKIAGKGKVIGISYLASSRGIAFGYKIDDYPFVRYTPHCLNKLKLYGEFSIGMPAKIEHIPILCDETFQSSGFKVSFCSEIEFSNRFEFMIGNSEEKPRGTCIALHIWMVGYNLMPLEGNLLKDNFWAFPIIHKNTVKSGLDIDLGEPKYDNLRINIEKEEFGLW